MEMDLKKKYIYLNHFAVHLKHNIVNQLYFNKKKQSKVRVKGSIVL